jgi:hypothetical protein
MAAMRKCDGEDGGEEVTVAATEIDQACGRTIGIFPSDPVKPQFLLAENGMKALKIATAGKSGGIGRGERVEFFGSKVTKAHERTSRRAP